MTQESALAVRESSGAAIVKAVPIPAQLQDLGVKIAEDEGGLRVIVLPPEVRNAVNLLTPVSSWGQADPNWTPSISLVKLDAEAHTYPLPGSKKGLNKQALEALGKTAGVLYTRTARVPKDELQEGEMWAYRATVGFRRSDGTIDEVTRERGFNREAEMLDIEGAVKGNASYDTPAKVEAEIKKRWIAELRFGPAKTESKAINRALRAGLGIPSSVTAAQLNKPFLVVGFNFTPDYDDPEVKRALVAVAMNAQAAIYGGRERSEEMPEHGGADLPAAALEPATPGGSPADVAEAERAADQESQERAPDETRGGDAEQGGGTEATPAAASSEPDLDEPEKPRTILRVPAAAIDAAGAVIARGEATVKDVAERGAAGDAKALEWLKWAVSHLTQEDDRLGSIRLYLEQRHPDVWDAITPEASDAE